MRSVQSSYWFIPSLMALASVLLGAVMIWLDARLGADWLGGVSWYQQIRVDGAREVLSTIAGSMITVAGVVFSITIVALSYASGQYGPRVLTNFMNDRGNTLTLGTFIATFLYCLAVLRTIRGGDNDFVPQLSVFLALLLAICSIGVLIYFIHHVVQSIHINHVVARIGRQLIADARHRFPELIGDAVSDDDHLPALAGRSWAPVPSDATGYVQSIEQERLIDLAGDRDLLIRLRYRPGDFVVAGRGLVDVSPPGQIDDRLRGALRDCFTVGRRRTPEGDIMFLVSELVEIATRALSPGINDPMTAVTCLDWLGAGASEFVRRRLPRAVRVGEDGTPRVIAMPVGFAEFLDLSFGRLRHYAAGDMIAGLHYLRVLGEVAAASRQDDQVRMIGVHAERFATLAGEILSGADRDAVMSRFEQLRQLLTHPPGEIDRRQVEWLGGSA